ncbi:MAG: STT3 domain-containing protein, partial [Myxococcota bacterium]
MTRRVGLTDLFASCGLFLLGLVIRALPVPTMLLGRDGATFFGNDAYYHVRRIWYSVVHFPEVLQRDPYMNFPEGGQPIWTPTFDWLIAATVRLGLGLPEQEVMEAWIIWVPPVLGALTVVALYFLALRYFSRTVAVVSGLLLALLPAHFWYSQLGFIDHHVAVALVTTGLLAATMSVLSHEPGAGAWRRALCLGTAFAASLWVWPGCLLFVVVAEIGLSVRLISSDRREMAVGWGRLFVLANALAFLFVLPLGLGSEWERWGRFSPLVFSEFQPLMFGLAALGFLALSEFWQRIAYPARRLDRVLQAAFAAGVLIGLTLTVLPVLSEGLGAGWSWLAKGENFQAGVGESKPLFRGGGRRAEEFFTRAIYLAPLVLVVFWGRMRRRADRAACFFLVGWSAALAAAALMQIRFSNSFSVAWSLLLAWSLVEIVSRTRAQLSSRAGVRWIALAAGVLVLLFVVTPSVMSYRAYAFNIVRSSRGEPPRNNYLERLQAVRE